MASTPVDLEKALDYLPTPITLVSVTANGRQNVMTAARFVGISSNPVLVGVSIASSRFTYDGIKTSGEFVVNLVASDQADLAMKVGKISGRDVDKFSEFVIATRPATKVESPLIEGCAAHMECKLVNAIELGDRMLMVGEVVAMHVDEGKTPATRLRGKFRELGD